MLKNHLVWNEHRHSVGYAAIDAEHQHIIELINAINDILGSGQGIDAAWQSMDELVAYTQTHFTHEERLMACHDYPDAPAHSAEHRKLLEQIGNLIDKAKHYPSQVGANLVTAFLADWAELHIVHDDRKLGVFLAAQGISSPI